MNNREYLSPGTAKAVFKAFNQIYITGKSTKNLEVDLLRADGSIRSLEISAALIKDAEDQAAGFRGFARDVTKRKWFEEELRQSYKMEAIGTLAGGIAHEFNNVLGIIIGNTELAMDDVPESNPAQGCLKEIHKASLRAKEVVRQILFLARKVSAERKPVRIVTVLRDSLQMMRASTPATIEIRQHISCTSETILADATELNQLFMNLCTNAIHSMRGEGNVLDISLECLSLDQTAALQYEGLAAGKFVKLTVKDTGQGIAPKIMGRIFDPFFTTKDVGNSGMGLAVVYGIIKKQDGAIKVESKLGKGTVVNVLFPLLDDIEETEVKEKPPRLPTGTGRILFVDDETALTTMAAAMLERLGYEVVTQTDPRETLALFEAHSDRFDLVITDMAMPHMAGDKLAHELMRIRRDIPIILCTGHSDDIDEARAKALGIKHYAMKPIGMKEIAQTISKLLAER